jgi:hypothetical protein
MQILSIRSSTIGQAFLRRKIAAKLLLIGSYSRQPVLRITR